MSTIATIGPGVGSNLIQRFTGRGDQRVELAPRFLPPRPSPGLQAEVELALHEAKRHGYREVLLRQGVGYDVLVQVREGE